MISLAPWISVRNSAAAIQFYNSAFGTTEAYRLDTPDGPIARLSIEGADFWVSGDLASPEPAGGGSVRIILTVQDPDTVFAKALEAGAVEVFPVGEAHGWRLGRVVDPFGMHWEIGRPPI